MESYGYFMSLAGILTLSGERLDQIDTVSSNGEPETLSSGRPTVRTPSKPILIDASTGHDEEPSHWTSVPYTAD